MQTFHRPSHPYYLHEMAWRTNWTEYAAASGLTLSVEKHSGNWQGTSLFGQGRLIAATKLHLGCERIPEGEPLRPRRRGSDSHYRPKVFVQHGQVDTDTGLIKFNYEGNYAPYGKGFQACWWDPHQRTWLVVRQPKEDNAQQDG